MTAQHKPTPESAAQVEALSGYGIRHDEIATYLGVDAKTLRKYYRDQLDKGMIKANVGVARALHSNALGGNVAAQIFWMKTRCGWKETAVFQHASDPDNPIDMSGVSDDAIRQLAAALGVSRA